MARFQNIFTEIFLLWLKIAKIATRAKEEEEEEEEEEENPLNIFT